MKSLNFIKFIILTSLLFNIIGCDVKVPETEVTNDGTTTEETEPVPNYFPISINYPGEQHSLIIDQEFKFSISGGKPPYSFLITSGPGIIDSDGTFHAGSLVGNTIVEIKDSSNKIITSRIKIGPKLKVDPEVSKIVVNDGKLLNISGGIPPYSFFIENGSGFINGLGFFTSNANPSTTNIRIYDSTGESVLAQVISNYPLQINPNAFEINRGDYKQFEAINGFPPYSYRVIGANGSINTSGFYSAPSIAGVATIEVSDSIGQVANSSVIISSANLSVNNQNLTIQVNKSFQFKPSGGLAPYYFEKVSGNGTVMPSGLYYAPSASGVDVLKLKDAEDNEVLINVSISDELTISPNSLVTNKGLTENLYANGGVPPYTFQILSGGGVVSNAIDNNIGVFVAPQALGIVTIQLRDSQDNIALAQIEVSPNLEIFPKNAIISIGNSIPFSASGGIPPYTFSIKDGTGTISSNGIYQADSGVIFSQQSVIVEVTDLKGQKKETNLLVNPSVDFSESELLVKSGQEKTILAINGVPPYTLRFKNGSSVFGSSIVNTPNGLGGYNMKYISGFVTNDSIEKIEIVDSLNNTVVKNIKILGGMIANIDFDKAKTLSSNNLLQSNSISLVNNSEIVTVNKINHGLNSSSSILIKNSMTECSNFDDNDFNKIFDIYSIIDSNNFSIKMNKKSTQNVSCGNGSSYSYDVLSNRVGETAPSSGVIPVLNLLNFRNDQLEATSSIIGVNMFYGTCGKAPGCTDPYNFLLSRDTNSARRNLNLSLNLTKDPNTNVTVEMWFKWNGDRSPDTSPATPSFNGTLVGFNNYNVSYMTVTGSTGASYKALCYNTSNASQDCYGMNNPDPITSNKWTHYVFIFNNGDVTKNKIYINGQLKSLSKLGSTNPTSRTVSDNFKIGLNYNALTTYFRITGNLGITKIYDRELLSNEVLNNYNNDKCLYQNICL